MDEVNNSIYGADTDNTNSRVPFACKDLISRAFSPNVTVTASEDTTALCKDLGFSGGLLDLLRPFGDQISGRVTVRDSQNVSVSFDDFCIRFAEPIRPKGPEDSSLFNIDHLEQFLQHQLKHDPKDIYTEFFKKVLGLFPVTHFETFSHPVAGVIAISSKCQQPIETLSSLYHQSHESVPEFIDKDYLRYYVLVHDETNDDLDKSIALFEKMKRNFGVHCHMMRISRQTDQPVDMAKSMWCTASEWLNRSDSKIHLHEDDINAVRQFCRELVASSVIPFMERCIATWNDQVAASRRGLTGRFFSASKKYFSKPQGTSSPVLLDNSYHYKSPEATLRKLADYAFMLRDYRFAHTTYELLKRDFHNDKAWGYLASAQEMAAVSWLMHGNLTIKNKNDNLDPLLDSAVYSYISRCSLPTYALRCILMTSELYCTQFKSPPTVASDGATKWILKALNERLVGRLGYALLMQRLSGAYAVHNEIAMSSSPSLAPQSATQSTTSVNSGSTPSATSTSSSRSRKAAFWMMLAAREWNDASQCGQSQYCLDISDQLAYSALEWTKSPTGLFGRLRRAQIQD